MDWVVKETKRLEKLRKSLSIEDYLTELDNCIAVAQRDHAEQFRAYDHFTETPLTGPQKAAKERLSFYQSAFEPLQDAETTYRNTPISFDEWKENYPIIWAGINEQLEAEKALFLGEYTNEHYSAEYKEKVYKDALKSVKRLLKKKESKYGDNPSDYYYPITGKSCYRWVNSSSAARVMLFRWLYFNWLDKKLFYEETSNQQQQTFMIWEGSESGLKALHSYLIENGYIKEIEYAVFKLHFEGKPQSEKINWIADLYGIYRLFSHLKDYVHTNFYSDDLLFNVTAGKIAPHFVFNGKPANLSSMYSAKSRGDDNKNKSDEWKANLNPLLARLAQDS